MRRDLGVTAWLDETIPGWAETLIYILTLPGDWMLIVPLLAGLYLADVLSTLRSPNTAPDEPLCSDRTVFIIGTVFGGLALVYLLKVSFGFSRPPEDWWAISVDTDSFPSGHTMAATVFWGTLAVWYERGSRRFRTLGAAAVIAIVGLARLALGVHFLLDIIAAIGFGCLYLGGIALIARDDPRRALLIAGIVAAVSIVITAGQPRAILAFVGIVGAYVGWRLVESSPIRLLLVERIAPRLPSS